MPTKQVKTTVADDAFGEAILVIAPFMSSLPPTYQPFLTRATSIIIQDHLLPQLNHLEYLVSLLPFTKASTIIYGALPPILESVRRTAHDLRGGNFEDYCYEYGIDGSDEIAMGQVWEMCEVVWEKAYFAAVSLGIKFGDALREEARANELRDKQKIKEGQSSTAGHITSTIVGTVTEDERAAKLKREVGEARKAFEATMKIVGKQEMVEQLWGAAAADEGVEVELLGEEDDQTNEGDKPVNPATRKPQHGNYDKVDTHDWAVTAPSTISIIPKETSETHPDAHAANAARLSSNSNTYTRPAADSSPDNRISAATKTDPAANSIINHTPAVALAADNNKTTPSATPQATTTTRTPRKRPGATPKKRMRWEMQYRPVVLAGTNSAGGDAHAGEGVKQ